MTDLKTRAAAHSIIAQRLALVEWGGREGLSLAAGPCAKDSSRVQFAKPGQMSPLYAPRLPSQDAGAAAISRLATAQYYLLSLGLGIGGGGGGVVAQNGVRCQGARYPRTPPRSDLLTSRPSPHVSDSADMAAE
ncbi:hypothetical protein P280DRAFT_478009 [Massarina eburnea CBS 473.64]|uniref:Uncharacterized protein n=1 Tax=Massarina eburnea CBS 473.64 TaxID=1395130 RepID=A0A6A6S868_9PLEO|nr:hypothetical protein P280DRAFT_478009 [Massarina eburnea CBS 473.64]